MQKIGLQAISATVKNLENLEITFNLNIDIKKLKIDLKIKPCSQLSGFENPTALKLTLKFQFFFKFENYQVISWSFTFGIG